MRGEGRGGRGGRGRHHDHSHDHGRESGRHGRRRMFDAGELALVLLHLTDGHLRHGYDLIREVEALTGGAYAPSPGIIYPTLTPSRRTQSDRSQGRRGVETRVRAH